MYNDLKVMAALDHKANGSPRTTALVWYVSKILRLYYNGHTQEVQEAKNFVKESLTVVKYDPEAKRDKI
jgi:hypothetical protein